MARASRSISRLFFRIRRVHHASEKMSETI